MNEPVPSIVVPCYNEASTVEALVDAVLAWRVSRKEIIIVDDASLSLRSNSARWVLHPRSQPTA